MNEGVFFPTFWSELQIRAWKKAFIGSDVQINFNQNDDGKYIIPIQPLRTLYLTNPIHFFELTSIFKIFGLEVKVNRGQGIFGGWHWRDDWNVVTSTENVDWINLNEDLNQFQLTKKIPILKKCVESETLYGLVIEQLAKINPLVDSDQLKSIFKQNQLVVSEWSNISINLAKDKHSLVSKNYQESKRVRIDQVFSSDHEILIIKRFSEAGVEYLDQVTPGNLDQIFHSHGIGGGRIKRIQSVLRLNGLPINDLKEPENLSIDNTLLGKGNQSLKNMLLDMDIENVKDIVPSTLLKLKNYTTLSTSLPNFIKRDIDYMAEKLPDYHVIVSMLPLGEKLFKFFHADETVPVTITIKEYLFLLSSIGVLKQRQRESLKMYPLLQERIEIIEKSIFSWDKNGVNLKKLNEILARAEIDIPETVSEEVLCYTWKCYELLLPNSIDYMVNQYCLSLREVGQNVVQARLQAVRPTTLQILAENYQLTRERIRQLEVRESETFINWWDELKLSIKLCAECPQNPIRLETVFRDTFARMVSRVIGKSNQILKNTELLDDEKFVEKIINMTLPLVKDKIWIDLQKIKDFWKESQIELTSAEQELVMKKLGFTENQNTEVWTKRNGRNSEQLIFLYMQQKGINVIGSSKEEYDQINEWSNKYFGNSIAKNLRSYNAVMSRSSYLLPISNGQFKLFDLSNYDPSLFEDAKKILQKKFDTDYQFVRASWLMHQLEDRLPNGMTNDEFYQVFHVLYPDEFEYSTGRNNDFYALGTPPLTINRQIEIVAQDSTKSIPFSKLKEKFGWEDYTVLQAAQLDPMLVIDGDMLSWIDYPTAVQELSSPVLEFMKRRLKESIIISVNEVYAFYNEFMMSHSELFEKTRIYTKSGLISFLKALPIAIDVVGNQLIIKSDELPQVPRKNDKIWETFLAKRVSVPKSEKEIKKIVLRAGMGSSTWDQVRERYLDEANILTISEDLYLVIDRLPQNTEISVQVEKFLKLKFAHTEFLPIQSIKAKDLIDFPEVVIKNGQKKEEKLSWTPELVACYAIHMGYRRLQWPKNMIRRHYDVLVYKSSKYLNTSSLMTDLLSEWTKYETNEINLYKHAVSDGLMPNQDDINKLSFPTAFYEDQNFEVDELRNVRRKN